jgi:hypothetical protein
MLLATLVFLAAGSMVLDILTNSVHSFAISPHHRTTGHHILLYCLSWCSHLQQRIPVSVAVPDENRPQFFSSVGESSDRLSERSDRGLGWSPL